MTGGVYDGDGNQGVYTTARGTASVVVEFPSTAIPLTERLAPHGARGVVRVSSGDVVVVVMPPKKSVTTITTGVTSGGGGEGVAACQGIADTAATQQARRGKDGHWQGPATPASGAMLGARCPGPPRPRPDSPHPP